MSESFALPERFNAADHFILPQTRGGRGSRPYLYCGEDVLTFAGLDALANRAARLFAALGVQPEQRVALILPDGFDFAGCFWGAVRMGAVAVPLNTQWPGSEYRHCLEDSRARVLVVDAEFWPRVEPALEGLRRKPQVVIAGGLAPGLPSLAALFAETPAEPVSEPTHRDEPAFWLYTSGSTGAPKAAVHLHHDMVYPADRFARVFLGLREDDVTFSASKLFFAYGLGNSLYFPLAAGCAAVVLRERPNAERLFALLARHRPTVFYAVPTLFNAMLNAHEAWESGRAPLPSSLAGPPQLDHLRRVISAGEPLPAEIHRRWKTRFGQEILDGIGSTEMLQTFISNPPDASREGSTGVVVPGYEARLVDEQGRAVPDGEPGTLWARGESSSPFYWNRGEKTRATMIGPWIVTGDRFRRDADGYFWYEGRADDMLKVGGAWVSPVEVENILLGHEATFECAVVGCADGQGLIRAKAFVVPKPGRAADDALAESLLAHAASRLPPFKRPHWIEFRDELPKTATGKIRRFLLRA